MSLVVLKLTEPDDQKYDPVREMTIEYKEPQTTKELEEMFVHLAKNLGFSYVQEVKFITGSDNADT